MKSDISRTVHPGNHPFTKASTAEDPPSLDDEEHMLVTCALKSEGDLRNDFDMGSLSCPLPPLDPDPDPDSLMSD